MGQISVKPKAKDAATSDDEVVTTKKRSAVRRMTRKNEPIQVVVLKRSEMSDQKKLDIASAFAGRKIASIEEAEKILFGRKKRIEKKEASAGNTRMKEIAQIVQEIVEQHVQQQLAEKNVQKKDTTTKPADDPLAREAEMNAILTAPSGGKSVKKMTEDKEKKFFKDSYYFSPGPFWQHFGL